MFSTIYCFQLFVDMQNQSAPHNSASPSLILRPVIVTKFNFMIEFSYYSNYMLISNFCFSRNYIPFYYYYVLITISESSDILQLKYYCRKKQFRKSFLNQTIESIFFFIVQNALWWLFKSKYLPVQNESGPHLFILSYSKISVRSATDDRYA